MDAPSPQDPSRPIPPGADHGKTCLIALAATALFLAVAGGLVAVMGLPRQTTEASYYLLATLVGFAFCAGQGAGVTGLIAMKQKRNGLYLLPAVAGAGLGVAAFVALFAWIMVLSLQSSRVFH